MVTLEDLVVLLFCLFILALTSVLSGVLQQVMNRKKALAGLWLLSGSVADRRRGLRLRIGRFRSGRLGGRRGRRDRRGRRGRRLRRINGWRWDRLDSMLDFR